VNELSILISGSGLTLLNAKLHPVARAVRDRVRPPRTYGLDPESILGSGLRPKFNGDFLVYRYICDKIFTKIRSLAPEI